MTNLDIQFSWELVVCRAWALECEGSILATILESSFDVTLDRCR